VNCVIKEMMMMMMNMRLCLKDNTRYDVVTT